MKVPTILRRVLNLFVPRARVWVSCLVVILTAAMAANENTDCSLSSRQKHAQAFGPTLVFYIPARDTVNWARGSHDRAISEMNCSLRTRLIRLLPSSLGRAVSFTNFHKLVPTANPKSAISASIRSYWLNHTIYNDL